MYIVYHNLLTLKQKVFGYKGEFQSDFNENLTDIFQISLKILVNFTDFKSTSYDMYDKGLKSCHRL